MRRNILLMISVAVAVIALVAACGSGGGGGSERFSTVEIFASFDEQVYTSDAQVKQDVDGDGDCIPLDFSLTDDDVIATVTSLAYDPLPEGVDPCNVNILRYNLRYFPQRGDTPSFPSKVINQSINIPAPGGAGSTVAQDISIRVFSIADKSALLSLFAASPAPEFQYDVKVTLTMEEVCTRIQEDVDFWIPVRYFDVADPCEGG